MRRKRAKSKKDRLQLAITVLFGFAFLLIIYLVQTTDKLIRVHEINAVNNSKIVLPSQITSGASCGT